MYQQKKTSQASGGAVAKIVISAMLIILAAFIFYFRQWIYDAAVYSFYRPSSDIRSIESQIDLTDYGKFLLYASQPKVDDATSFNADCNKTETTTSVLGCYANSRIFIYNVATTQLDGIKQVTAAHEMLHSAYTHLNAVDKAKVDTMIEAEYAKLKDDSTFKALAAYYSKTEPGELDNELHSIIGTQVASLSPELENYYKRYFTDRQAVVQLYQKYFSVFQTLSDKAASLLSQINDLKATIESSSSQYNADVTALKNDIASFNSRANSGGFSSQGAFAAERADLIARQETLEANRQSINDQISRYDDLITQYNSIALQSQKLQNSLNSSLASSPSI